MTDQEIRTAILNVCKVANWDGDFNVVGFHALCDKLKELGAVAEREACAQIVEQFSKRHGLHTRHCVAAAIRARGQA